MGAPPWALPPSMHASNLAVQAARGEAKKAKRQKVQRRDRGRTKGDRAGGSAAFARGERSVSEMGTGRVLHT